jgi:stearoyl-CoA desaturase (delta-9 desaturase)
MTALERRVNMTAVFLPFAVVAVAIPLLWGNLAGWSDVVVFVLMYLISGLGITVGFHRMLTHRAFQTHPVTRYAFAIAGSMAVQGPVIDWVADHRKHHAHTDVEGDPHSPHVGHGDGVLGAMRGLWHAHVGWLWRTHGEARAHKYAKDLVEDRGMRVINRRFPLIVLLSLAIPAVLGGLLSWSLKGAFTGLIWGGFVRIFLQHHVTWSVNSVCHFFGKRRFEVEDQSTNVFWLAIPSFGESWHHNHHAFPRSAAHGLRWYEIDTSAMLIGLMRRVGLAWDVVKITPERQQQKLAGAAAPAPEREKVAEPV